MNIIKYEFDLNYKDATASRFNISVDENYSFSTLLRMHLKMIFIFGFKIIKLAH